MKLQGVSIIFALIVLPLILVLTYYIHLQVDTIEMQNEFDKKLLDSTNGAMSAFEINTANEDLSTVSDSLRTIIDASTNIFMNTLATNLGMSNASNSYLEPYIPAILYTLYDGYYISAPTRSPKILSDYDGNAVYVGETGLTVSGSNYFFTMVHTNQESQNNCTNCDLIRNSTTGEIESASPGTEGHITYDEYSTLDEDGKTDLQIRYKDLAEDEKENYGQLVYVKDSTSSPIQYTTDVNQAETEIKHVLKTYMPYSARYKKEGTGEDTFDIVAIYTLDNYLTIEGTIGNIYYTKSGYLIPNNSIKVTNINDDNTSEEKNKSLLSYNQNDAQKFIEDGNFVEILVKDNPKDETSNEGTTLSSGNQEDGKRLEYLERNLVLINEAINKINNENEEEPVDISFVDGFVNNFGTPYNYTATDALNKAIEARTFLENDKKEIKNKNSKTGLEDRLRVLNNNYTIVTALVAECEKSENPDEVDISIIDGLKHNSGANYAYTAGATKLTKVNEAKNKLTEDMNEIQYRLDEMSSVSYYVAAEIFSTWVAENLSHVEEQHLIEISGQDYNLIKGEMKVSHDFSGSTTKVFNIVGTSNVFSKLNSPIEIDKDSAYYSHKLNVIRDSIQYNLNLSMTTYNKMSISAKDYAMPVMENEEWEKILTNISIATFMQGYNCGLKTYNNYKIVSSTNNEISLLPEEIYYVKKENFSNENSEYHRIDCNKLYDMDDGDTDQYLAFVSKDVKYDKLYDKTNALVPYQYDHKNLACYECINDGNYKGKKIFNNPPERGKERNLLKAYYIGVGKSRNNLYKMNAFNISEGYEIIYDKSGELTELANASELELNKIKAIEIVLDTIKTTDAEENVLNYKVKFDDEYLTDTTFTIVPNVTTRSTIKINVKPDLTSHSGISANQLIFQNQYSQSTAYCTETQRNEETNQDYYKDRFDEKSSIIFKDAIRFVKVIYR